MLAGASGGMNSVTPATLLVRWISPWSRTSSTTVWKKLGSYGSAALRVREHPGDNRVVLERLGEYLDHLGGVRQSGRADRFPGRWPRATSDLSIHGACHHD